MEQQSIQLDTATIAYINQLANDIRLLNQAVNSTSAMIKKTIERKK